MLSRIFIPLFILALSASATAQTTVRTETIRRPAAPEQSSTGNFKSNGRLLARSMHTAPPEITGDLSRLPPAVAQMRDKILSAARTGNLQTLLAVMRTSGTMPVFSYSEDKDPIAYWKMNYPDTDGVEVLATLISILEAPFAHVEQNTPQEVYLWPYFARMPLAALSPEQKVELFRIVTGGDYKEMVNVGAYSFFRIGISPDGSWQFFVAGE